MSEKPSAASETRQLPAGKDTTPSREGGRFNLVSKRVAARIKTIFGRDNNSDKVLRQLSKEGPNIGVDLDKKGSDAADWKKATKRNVGRLLLGRKLDKEARRWAKGHKQEVDAKYKELAGTKDADLSRKDRFRKYAEAISATRLAAGAELRKSVLDIQQSQDYTDRVTQALNDKTQDKGRTLTARETQKAKRIQLKKMYNEQQRRQNSTPATGEVAQTVDGVQVPDSPAALDTLTSPARHEQSGDERTLQPNDPGRLPDNATADDLQRAFDASSGVNDSMPAQERNASSEATNPTVSAESIDGTGSATAGATSEGNPGQETPESVQPADLLAASGLSSDEITQLLGSEKGKELIAMMQASPEQAKTFLTEIQQGQQRIKALFAELGWGYDAKKSA